MPDKPKVGMYWAASCGGCEIALCNIHEHLLDVAANFDFMFCPCLIDTKKKDIEAMPDKSIAIMFFNGAIRTEENEEMAHLLRRKAQVLIAFGSCAYEGCIPSLANFSTRAEMLKTVYLDSPSLDNQAGIVPQSASEAGGMTLTLPSLRSSVNALAQVVDVDYSIPGCPPESHQIWNVIDLVIKGGPLPPKGSILGAGNKTVCEECNRTKSNKKISRLYRTYEIIPDKEQCLLEQGILCMGVATRDGCGAPCTKVNMPCVGCYGPPDGVEDQGAKMISTLGSILDIDAQKNMSEDEINTAVDRVLDAIPDFGGQVYKFSLAGSMLRHTLRKEA